MRRNQLHRMDRDDDNTADDYKERRLSALSAHSGASTDMNAKRRHPRLARQFSGFTTPKTVGEAFIGFPFPLTPRVVEEEEPEPKKKEEEEVSAWDLDDLVYNWAQNTTFHGVKYLSEDSDVRIRKYIWFLALLGCNILLIYQISSRIITYLDCPVNVNVKVNYNRSILFPTVTLCNQNQYRISKAYNSELVDVLSIMGKYGKSTINVSTIQEELNIRAQNMTTLSIYNQTAHDIHDMLLSCKWNGLDCDARNFTRVYTDQGVCFSFNHVQDPSTKKVSDAGIGKGLTVTLNVQQYEYLPKFHDSAGIRFLLHADDTVPMVTALGQAAATGTHTYVGVEANKVSYLTKPYGVCEKYKKLERYGVYNQLNCKMECRTQNFEKECGCREFYMPAGPDREKAKSICNLTQHYSCINTALMGRNRTYVKHYTEAEVFIQTDQQCRCGIACDSVLYDSSLSFASTSNLAVEEIRSNKTIFKRLEREFTLTKDINSFLDQKSRHRDLATIQDFLNAYQSFETFMEKQIPEDLKEGGETLVREVGYIHSLATQLLNIFKNQSEIIRINFFRGYESADERTFQQVGFQLYEFRTFIESKLKDLDPANTQQAFRDAVYKDALMMLDIKAGSCKFAKSKVNELTNCYMVPKQYFDEPKLVPSFEVMLQIIPHNLMKERLLKAIQTEPIWNKTLEKMDVMKTTIYPTMRDLLTRAYKGERMTEAISSPVINDYIDSSKSWLKFRGEILKTVFEAPLKVLESKISLMEIFVTQIKSLKRTIDGSTKNVRRDIDKKVSMQWKSEHANNLQLLVRRFGDSIHSSKNKISFFKSLFSQKFIRAIVAMETEKNYLMESKRLLKTHFSSWYKWWQDLEIKATTTWERIINNTDCYPFYELLGLNWLHLNMTHIKKNMTKFYKTTYDKYNNDMKLDEKFENLEYTTTILQDNLKEYNESVQITSEIIKDNILTLDIFFKELSIRAIEQQVGYTLSSLLSDIGGLLGLCIGASLLSIVEIMDLVGQLIFQTHHRLKKRTKANNMKAFHKKKEKPAKCVDKNDRPLVSNYCTPGDFKWHERDPSNSSKLTAV